MSGNFQNLQYGAPSYGNAPPVRFDDGTKVPFTYRRRVNLTVLMLCLFIPVVLFALVCASLSFTVHHDMPPVTWLTVALGAIATFAVGFLAFMAVKRRYSDGDVARESYWYIFLFVTMLLAYIFAFCLGFVNYWNNMLPYLDMQSLSVHPAVDLNTMTSQQLMDVGRVTFTEGTKLDSKRSIGFKNVDRYCVAPIVPPGGKKLETYDFWAIGLNCCSGNTADFHCGEFDNPNARSGLRLMRADQRGFYRLAVQQAEATYGIQAKHPLFFYWMQNAVSELESYRGDAIRYFLLGLASTFSCQLLFLMGAVLVYQKL